MIRKTPVGDIGLGIVVLIAWLASAMPAAAQVGWTADQARAFERALVLEAAGDLLGAQQSLVSAFGAIPDRYDVCLRLAWLTLQRGDGAQAARLYRRARQLPGALPEATTGLVTALSMAGYAAIDRGDLPEARRVFGEAHRLDPTRESVTRGLEIVGPSQAISPEMWFGRIGMSADGSTASVLYAALPIRLNEATTLRAVYRKIASPSSSTAGSSAFAVQDELFGGLTVERGSMATELIGFRLHNVFADTTGLAMQVRVGGRRGATALVAGQHTPAGWNAQVAPQVFVWVRPSLAIAAGVRLTSDPGQGRSTSVTIGVTAVGRRGELDLQAHAGQERSALTLAGPMVLSFVSGTSSGVTATVSGAVSSRVTVFGQVQIETLADDAGRYASTAGGIRVTMPSRRSRR